MGMYTELVLKCEVKENIPDEVHAVLQYLFGKGDLPSEIPDHPFFKCARWGMLGNCSSFYHIPFAISKYGNVLDDSKKGGHIFSRSDLKNYDSEIEKFMDWVDQYLDDFEGDCIGWKLYEEEITPTLLFKKAPNV